MTDLPDLPPRIIIDPHARPRGTSGVGKVISQNSGIVLVRLDDNGIEYVFGKNVVKPLHEED